MLISLSRWTEWLVALLLVATPAWSGAPAGDVFTLSVSESGFLIGSDNGVIGVSGARVEDGQVNWLDDDTFELDFFANGEQVDLTFVISGIDREVAGVTQTGTPLFGWDYDLSFDTSSITIVYPFLDGMQAGDGDIVTFDVEFAVLPDLICDAGPSEGASCTTDADCAGVCTGSQSDGLACADEGDCLGFCDVAGTPCQSDGECPDLPGGFCSQTGIGCFSDADCPPAEGICLGAGPLDGTPCFDDFECVYIEPGICDGEQCLTGPVGAPCFDDFECEEFALGFCDILPDVCIDDSIPDFCERTGILCEQTAMCIEAAEPPDFDDDGVADEVDNCALIPNPDQADANAGVDDDSSLPGVQSYGDACDLDFDDDGVVGPADFFSGFRPCLGQDPASVPACRAADCDGDGAVGPSDFFGCFRPKLGRPPGPGAGEIPI